MIARFLAWLSTPIRAADARALAIARALVDPQARRAAALILIAGAGMAWTVIAVAVLTMLYRARDIGGVFWMGVGAWAIVTIVVTGYCSILFKRSIKINRNGIEIVDADTATAAVAAAAPVGDR